MAWSTMLTVKNRVFCFGGWRRPLCYTQCDSQCLHDKSLHLATTNFGQVNVNIRNLIKPHNNYLKLTYS